MMNIFFLPQKSIIRKEKESALKRRKEYQDQSLLVNSSKNDLDTNNIHYIGNFATDHQFSRRLKIHHAIRNVESTPTTIRTTVTFIPSQD